MADSTGWIFWYNERWYEYTAPDHGDRRQRDLLSDIARVRSTG